MSQLAIQSIGAITAGGDDVPATMASILSELQLFDQIAAVGSDGERLTGATTCIPRTISGLERLGALGLIALTECASTSSIAIGAVPLILCAPHTIDARGSAGDLLEQVTADARLNIDRQRSRVVAKGRSGAFEALMAARELLHGGRAPACYLVGVDCLIESQRAEALDREGRGCIPGEAAAALLLARQIDPQTMASIASLGFGEETRSPAGEGPVIGNGLTSAFDGALSSAHIDARQIVAFAHDGWGAANVAEELTLATQRPPLDRMGEVPLFSPSLSTGEVGAASAPLLLAMLAFYIAEGEIRGPALAALLSEDARRCAALVTPKGMQGIA